MLRTRSSSNSSYNPLGLSLPGSHKSWTSQLKGTPSSSEASAFNSQMTEVSEKDAKLFEQFKGHLRKDIDNVHDVRECTETFASDLKGSLKRADESSKWLDD